MGRHCGRGWQCFPRDHDREVAEDWKFWLVEYFLDTEPRYDAVSEGKYDAIEHAQDAVGVGVQLVMGNAWPSLGAGRIPAHGEFA